jgi:LuxR family maltose regulon positive regulatory protein
MTLARVQIAQGRTDTAAQTLSELAETALSQGRIARLIGIRVLQAVAAKQQGHTEAALGFLEAAVALGEAEGYVRVFLDEGAQVKIMLRQLQGQSTAQPYISRLLAAFDPKSAPVTKAEPPQNWVGSRIEPLSERELEVLRLLAEGASNREIAQQLIVSLGTVKKHVNNIFTKLDAHNRVQVLSIARENNLL